MRSTPPKKTTTVLVLAIDNKDASDSIPRRLGGPRDYVVVTPLSHVLARGLVADEVIVTPTIRSSPELQPLAKAIAPCFATTGGVEAALERAEVHL